MYIKKSKRRELGKRQEARGKRQEKRNRNSIAYWLLPVAFFFFSLNSNAQCAMCRAALETEEGGVKGEAVNDGILYLMVIPYLLVGIVGFAIYRMYFKKKKTK